MKSLKVLIASGAFKDVFSPMEACQMIQNILKKLSNNNLELDVIKSIPMVDGGEYSSDVLLASQNVEKVFITGVIDPRGELIDTYYLKLDDNTAYIASSNVLRLPPGLEKYKNPLILTTYGLGQMIRDAIKNKFKNIIVGLGGTSTVDGGIGMAQALGANFYDKTGELVNNKRYLTGSDLERVDKIEICEDYDNINMTALCDATINIKQMFIPTNQKISSYYEKERKNMVALIENSLLNYSEVIKKCLIETNIISDQENLSEKKHYGVAGGIALSLLPLFNMKFSLGVEYFMTYFKMEDYIRKADIVITGEGKFDNSLEGKTPVGVSRLAKRFNKPVIYLVGNISGPQKDIKKQFVSYVSNNLPREFIESGITTMISCHPFFDLKEIPENYVERISFFREHNPLVLSEGLKMYFKRFGGNS